MSSLLACEKISFGYASGDPVLEDVSWQFPAGSITAISGASGRGKSTLLYVLGLMLKPDKGRVLLSGRSVLELADAARSRARATEFGFVFQDAALDATRTVLDNITESELYRGRSPRAATARAHELMERFGVGLRAGHRPGTVSGGQAQRIALCRALIGEPKILIADEPTGNLDAEAARVVVDAFRDFSSRGGCVLIATHDAALAAECDGTLAL